MLSSLYYCAENLLAYSKGVTPALVTEMGPLVGSDAILAWQAVCAQSQVEISEALFQQLGPQAEAYRHKLDTFMKGLFLK